MEATGLKRRPVAPRLPCTENSPGAFKDQKGIASLERVIFRFRPPNSLGPADGRKKPSEVVSRRSSENKSRIFKYLC
jgi:hypothetical protein